MTKTYRIKTGVGKMDWDDKAKLTFLSQNELDNIDSIGYCSKTLEGTKTTVERYLNTLNKGSFRWINIRPDNGDFCEEYQLIHSTNLSLKQLNELINNLTPI